MCINCRNKIRERAITKQMDQEQIPVDSRAIFERGAKFGELMAALFLEKSTRDMVEETTPILALMAILSDDKTMDDKLVSIETMQAVYKHQVMEGGQLTFGKFTGDSKIKVNALRAIHELPLLDSDPAAGKKDPIGDMLAELLRKATAEADKQPNASKQN